MQELISQTLLAIYALTHIKEKIKMKVGLFLKILINSDMNQLKILTF